MAHNRFSYTLIQNCTYKHAWKNYLARPKRKSELIGFRNAANCQRVCEKTITSNFVEQYYEVNIPRKLYIE